MGKITKRISTYWTGMGLLVRVRQGAHEPDREGARRRGRMSPCLSPICVCACPPLDGKLARLLLGQYDRTHLERGGDGVHAHISTQQPVRPLASQDVARGERERRYGRSKSVKDGQV